MSDTPVGKFVQQTSAIDALNDQFHTQNRGSGHTPGPWAAKKAAHGPIDILDCNGRDVVTVYGGGVTESKEANARLIAAAPDMLYLLERAQHLVPDVNKNWHAALAGLLTAIAGNAS